MPRKRTRWVKRGTARRPTGRVRRKKAANRNYTVVKIFPSMRRTMPDRLHVTLYSDFAFNSTAGVGTNGVPTPGSMAYFNVNGMSLANPYAASGSGPTFQPYATAVGSQGFGALAAPLPGQTATAPAFFTTLMGIYHFYYVKASGITVECDLDNVNDEGTIAIRPLNNSTANTTLMDNLCESRFVKTCKVGHYSTGNKGANKVSNYISTATVLGYPIGDDKMTLEGGFVGTLSNGPSSPWIWQIGYQNTLARVTSAQMFIRIRVRYETILFQPDQHKS